jgi:hypothetical protein
MEPGIRPEAEVEDQASAITATVLANKQWNHEKEPLATRQRKGLRKGIQPNEEQAEDQDSVPLVKSQPDNYVIRVYNRPREARARSQQDETEARHRQHKAK